MTFVECRCICGTQRATMLCNLRTGKSLSCGCQSNGRIAAALTRHGLTDSPEHNTWMQMRRRCEDPANKAFKNYGGRGICVDSRWRDSFEAFFADMGPRPSARHTIERMDNDGHYAPGNCRWATRKEQNRNKRNTVIVVHGGQKVRLIDLAEANGISPATLHTRRYAGRPLLG